ncbi:hypothetical protein BC629DRAFT_1725614, partial [Irpex lacteus]
MFLKLDLGQFVRHTYVLYIVTRMGHATVINSQRLPTYVITEEPLDIVDGTNRGCEAREKLEMSFVTSTNTTQISDVGGFMDVWGVDHIANCFQISAFVLCIFEHVATFDLEIIRMWRRRVSPVMLLFIINRYACLCYAASGLVQLAAWGNVDSRTANNMLSVPAYGFSCNITSRIGDISEDIMYLMFAFFAALRTYAIWDKNWTVFACVLLPGLIFPIGAIYIDVVSTYTSRSHVGSGSTGCYKENYFPADGSHSEIESYNNLYTVGRCSIILFECITLSLTWAKTIPVVRRLRHHNLSTGSLI